jgi:hypothetical protein
MQQRYPCVVVQQSNDSSQLILFSAPATQIDTWVGIPQRLSINTAETAGFQRTVSKTRENALRKFFADPKNVIQNPLLCAIRRDPGIQVRFEPAEQDSKIGYVSIEFDDYKSSSMPELLSAARASLEERVPSLGQRPRPDQLMAKLQSLLSSNEFGEYAEFADSDEELSDETTEQNGLNEGEPAEEALFDESQITEFWDHLSAREHLSKKVIELAESDEVFGFTRAMLESYLRPIILVDGQHRLIGALLASRDQQDDSESAQALILNGHTPEQARAELEERSVRNLPVSLLMNSSPAEHVFQYVVVNQKATPVPKALLGTIISTSLAADELKSIADRLEDAKIPLEGSRVVSILSRAADSPFVGLVAKGMESDSAALLPWSVLGSLADMFRYLEDGKYYHEPTDHARVWRGHQLEKSGIVQDWHSAGYPSGYAYWQDLNGPWVGVFKAFWKQTILKLADTKTPGAKNYWGSPRDSNIFNKPSLHILAADFFCYLRETKSSIGSVDSVSNLVDEWLEYVNTQYFARDWKLEGVKKDSVGTRKQWSKLWANHRKGVIQMPAPGMFSQLFKG